MKTYPFQFHVRLLLAIVISFFSPSISKSSTLFYQPLNRDRNIDSVEWAHLWRKAYEKDFRQIVVQWTAFGDQLIDPENWLLNSLEIASQEGLQLIIGLHADPDFSQTILQAGWESRFEEYWNSLQRQSLVQQERLLPLLSARDISIDGWYFPSELSDILFTNSYRRQFVRNQLILMAENLNRPLHISAYNLGYLSPQGNAAWLSSLEKSGLKVWWQDGSGVGDLSPLILQAYYKALPCAVGVVSEAFVRIPNQGGSFSAKYAPPADYDPCHPASTFSLRYLPWAQSILKLQFN
ncbi:hypothetical protein MITS9509_02803 [Synechococcus sp. MIT S9509]|uniref:DUF4434 domain-containing protein n=1 Tax=unclassified Synechococcus TaxID=2626047 RepID=UPI0007BC658C|nr:MULTISPECIES: DUF4434 domain-containing protein [unclassified Synechococcus]KZR84941.1 hypothetical protein MITS9504_02559 [Synechococcus sp. MIT S9504]KZR90118.1 hypothetical protein MITS9509_02803 [Synechococcus sp. MIT S9509]